MSSRIIYTDLDLNKSSTIKQGGFEKLAADPVSPVEGQEWLNTSENVRKTVLNGVVVTYATTADLLTEINKLERAQGGFDASGGGLPTAANKTKGDLSTLIAGDQWVITNGGTITGILGDDVLSIGDKVEFLGGTATDPANWIGIQRNTDDTTSAGGGLKDRQVVNLVAGTPLTISSSIVTDIHSVEVYDATGKMIEVCIEKGAGANQRIIESNATLSNITVELLG